MTRLPNRVFLSRTDRLGDVLLSLPSVLKVKQCLPQTEVVFATAPFVLDLLKGWAQENQVRLVAWDRRKGFNEPNLGYFDIRIFLSWEPRLAIRLPRPFSGVRVANLSKPSSHILAPLLAPDSVQQKRSLSLKNERDYSLDLVQKALQKFAVSNPPGFPRIHLPVNETAKNSMLRKFPKIENAKYFVLHPGMGGSALNLSGLQYLRIFETLSKLWACPGFITIGPSGQDQAMKTELSRGVSNSIFVEGLSLVELAEFYRAAEWVAAPSTGPLHLANCVATNVLGFYPPVRSQRPIRWAPLAGQSPSVVLSPDVDCPGQRDCIGQKCPYFFCMEKYDWESQLSKAT